MISKINTKKFIQSFDGNIAPEFLDELIGAAVQMNVSAGARLFATGDLCENFIFITKGKARIRLSLKTGREITLFHLISGQSCALTTSCLLTQSPYYAEGIAETDLEIITFPVNIFNAALEVSPRWASALLKDYSNRIGGLIGLIDRLSVREIETELIAFLENESDDEGIITLSHKFIAEELCTAREVISRNLKKLQDRGVLRMQRGEIQLINII